MIDENLLMKILDSKESRANRQKELIYKYKDSLISFTLNIPGIIKDNSIYRDIHIEGMNIIERELSKNKICILYKEEKENITGREGYIVVDLDSYTLKEITTRIEDKNPLGRIFDIDVFSSEDKQISRANLDKTPRKCLLCGKDARVCMREKNHNYESLIKRVNDIWKEYIDK